MASLVIAGDTSGTITLAAPAVSGNNTLTLPASTGTLVTTSGSQTIEFAAGTAAAPAITTTGDTNTGIFFSAADTIDFSEGGTAVGQFDSSANFKFNSGYGSVATAYGCRAWVNFNGVGTVAIRASGNVTSITDNGTGDYTINFTNSMPDANYLAVTTGGQKGVSWGITLVSNTAAPTTSAFRYTTNTPSDVLVDTIYNFVAIIR